jgi:hypothetical protein
MKTVVTLAATLSVALISLTLFTRSALAKKARPTCPGGRFVVNGEPLVIGMDRSVRTAAVVVGRPAGTASLYGLCAPVRVKVRAADAARASARVGAPVMGPARRCA